MQHPPLARLGRLKARLWDDASQVRRGALLLAGAAALAGIAFFFLGRAAQFGRIGTAWHEADRRWFALCALGELLAYAGYILSYRDVARADGGPCLPLWAVTRVVVIGFGAFVVGSSAAGLAVDFLALKKAGAGTHESARRVLALNTLEWAVLGTAAAIAGAVSLAGAHAVPAGLAATWVAVVPACVAGALVLGRRRMVERLSAPRASGANRLRRLVDRFRSALADALGGVVLVRHVLRRPLEYPAALAGLPLYWVGELATLWVALHAFGVDVRPLGLVLAFATGYVVTILPLPAGGAGGMEVSLAFVLHGVGVPLAPAVLGVLVYARSASGCRWSRPWRFSPVSSLCSGRSRMPRGRRAIRTARARSWIRGAVGRTAGGRRMASETRLEAQRRCAARNAGSSASNLRVNSRR